MNTDDDEYLEEDWSECFIPDSLLSVNFLEIYGSELSAFSHKLVGFCPNVREMKIIFMTLMFS